MSNSSWPIYVDDRYQIVFHLQAPFIWFPGTLLTFCGLMFDTQWVLDHGGFGTPASINPYLNQHPIPGSGPYVVTGVAEQNYVKFSQGTPSYWGLKLNHSDIVTQPTSTPVMRGTIVVYFQG